MDKPKQINDGLILIEPLGYMDFLNLWKDSKVVITDSGGIQEETTVLGIPCITIRENTERPVTISVGSNELAGTDTERIKELASLAIKGDWKKSRVPELWDGRTSERIVDILSKAG